jgi:flagellar hook-basal body complex protein FliE
MAINGIEAIGELPQVYTPVETSNTAASPTFIDTVMASVSSVNDSLNHSEALVQNAALGESIPSHELMLAMERARLELNLALQVRNKLLDAYQEVMRMQI